MQTVQEHMHGVRGRKLILRRLNATWDMQSFTAAMVVGFVGIHPTEKAPDVNHCYRFVRRCDLELYQQHVDNPWEIGCDHLDTDPHDVILLVKQWVHSSMLSQNPVLAVAQNKVPVAEEALAKLEPMIRNSLSDNEVKQFRKSAGEFAKEPWEMERAKGYLLEFCRRNEEKDPQLLQPAFLVITPSQG
eukprot:9468143-Pyramimonas_sp.AAC.1